MMKMMKTILWLMIVSTFAIFDSTAASNRICEDKIVEPTNGHRQPRFVPQRLFATGSMIRFTCDDGYHLAPGTLPVQTCAEGVDGVARWVPSQAPHCVADAGCVFAVVDEELQVMPKKKFYDVGELIEYYCPFTAKDQFAVCLPNSTWSVDPLPCRRELRACDRPSVPAFGHMDCYIKDYGIPDALECPHMFMRGESVKFTCQQGFVLNSLSGDVWTCGYNGVWLGVNHTMTSLSPRPVCLMPGCASVDGSKLGSAMRDGEFSNEENEVGLMGNVPSVACVVLVVLLLVILVFFCQPKLKSIKRRWRDLREDENRLVVNGQTVQLPSYEQVDPNTTATTVTTTTVTDQQQSNFLNSLSRPNNIRHNDVTPVILLSSLPSNQQSLWRNEHEVSHTPNLNNQSDNRHQMNDDDVLQTGNDDDEVNDDDDVSCLLSLTPPPTTTVATDNHPTTSVLLRHNDHDDVRRDATTMTQSFDDSFVNSNVVMTHDNHDDVTTPCSPHDDDKLSSPHHNISFFSVMASDVQGVAPVGDGETEPKDATTGSTTQATQHDDDGKEWTSL